MRDLEFRAWHKTREKMYIVMNLTRPEQNPFTLVRESIDGTSEVVLTADLEIMQYTGLKDKNGVKIYENELIKYLGDFFVGRVGYDEKSASYLLMNLGGSRLFSEYLSEGYVSVGNIHENPDMIR
jgi:uncharacterized phage protein (TIGR01671 family)